MKLKISCISTYLSIYVRDLSKWKNLSLTEDGYKRQLYDYLIVYLVIITDKCHDFLINSFSL